MKKKEWIKPICANDHIWGNGKEFSMEEKCPKCGGDIVGFRQKKFMTYEQIKTYGWTLSQNFIQKSCPKR